MNVGSFALILCGESTWGVGGANLGNFMTWCVKYTPTKCVAFNFGFHFDIFIFTKLFTILSQSPVFFKISILFFKFIQNIIFFVEFTFKTKNFPRFSQLSCLKKEIHPKQIEKKHVSFSLSP
jgi:hypothetical protein